MTVSARALVVAGGRAAPAAFDLAAEGVCKSYRGRRVVDGVTVGVRAGEIVGLLGPNGAGKTTTFNMMAGLVKPEAGRIVLGDTDLTRVPVHRRALAGVGYLPQEPSTFRALTVEENLLLAWEMLPGGLDEGEARMERTLAEFGLTDVRHQNVCTLSGGERRRLELARAMACEPRYLLLDEPFTGVDPLHVAEIQDIVRRLRARGMGILITDHNATALLDLADRVYVIREGTILVSGTPDQVVDFPLARQHYLGEGFVYRRAAAAPAPPLEACSRREDGVVPPAPAAPTRRRRLGPKLLDRYVTSEMLRPFFFGVGSFTLVFLFLFPLPRAVEMLDSMPASSAAEFVVASIPLVLVYVHPAAALLACLLVFSRLSSDSEIVAMKAAGISLYRIAAPGLALTLVMSLVVLYIADRIVPEANYIQRAFLLRSLGRTEEAARRNIEIGVPGTDRGERVIMVHAFDPEKALLKSLTILYFQDNKRSRVVLADEAQWTGSGWMMRRVHSQDFDPSGALKGSSYSKTMALLLDRTPDQLLEPPRMRTEMSRPQLLVAARAALVRHDGKYTREVNRYLVDYYQRVAIPFSCLVFGLVGIPLGLRSNRSSRPIGYGLCLLFLLAYYMLSTLGVFLGEKGVIAPVAAAWVANVVFACAGAGMLVKEGRV